MTDRVTLIVRAVAKEFGTDEKSIMTPTHMRSVARPRQVAMAIARYLTKRSLPDLAKRFSAASATGAMHHTTILWACARVTTMRTHDADFAALYDRCLDRAIEAAGPPSQFRTGGAIETTYDQDTPEMIQRAIARTSAKLQALQERDAALKGAVSA